MQNTYTLAAPAIIAIRKPGFFARLTRLFAALLETSPDYTRQILSIDRGGPKPRKDIGKWEAAGAIAVGAELATDATGKAVAATSGAFIIGVALTAATTAGDLVQVQITKSGYKA